MVSGSISNHIRAYFDGPFMDLKEVSPHTIDRWWDDFKHVYRWDSSYAAALRREWEQYVPKRLPLLVHDLSLVPLSRAVPWCNIEIRIQLLAKRNHPNFQEKSRRNRENRNKRPSLHCQGSISITELKFKMTTELDREPSAP
ncbi:hypothetical protein Drorol1_Dr00005641 [Drosera rotundifolia]